MDSWTAEKASPVPVHGRKSLAKKKTEAKTFEERFFCCSKEAFHG
jgi:hypothetical protein